MAASTSSFNVDLEAQLGPVASTSRVIVTPLPVRTYTSVPSHMRISTSSTSDPILSEFGYTLQLSSTHESRHDEDLLNPSRQSISDFAPPPAYAEEAGIPLPEYTEQAPEPVTLAMYLFKFGFLFFPFWIFGAFILLSPLSEPPTSSESESQISLPTWMPEKTEEERKQIIATLRAVELKWARRCLCAILVFTALVVSGAIAAWAILHMH